MTTGTDTGAEAGRSEELRDDYRRLAGLHTPHAITRRLNEGRWVEANLLLDGRLTELEVAERVGVEPTVIATVSSARRCLQDYRWNPDELKRCLDAAKAG